MHIANISWQKKRCGPLYTMNIQKNNTMQRVKVLSTWEYTCHKVSIANLNVHNSIQNLHQVESNVSNVNSCLNMDVKTNLYSYVHQHTYIAPTTI